MTILEHQLNRELAEAKADLATARRKLQEAEAAHREKIAQWMTAHSYATGHGDTLDDLLAELSGQVREQVDGLVESVKLQSHYADLLNMHDGGVRRTFASAADWIRRLRETGARGRTP